MHSTISKAAETYEEIVKKQNEDSKTEKPDYKILVERIVEKLENKNKIDLLSYNTLVKKYPQIKDTINQLISELRVFSIYDNEPNTVNFDYSAYLKQIEELVRIV